VDELPGGGKIRPRLSIAIEHGHPFPDPTMRLGDTETRTGRRAAHSRAALGGQGRAAKIEGLRRDEQLDADDPLHPVEHRARMSRRDRTHRDVVLLVRRGRDGIDRRRVGQHLVLGGEGSRRVLVDHHPGVHAG